MNNLRTPQTAEEKKFLEEECGLKPFTPQKCPSYADPDSPACKH